MYGSAPCRPTRDVWHALLSDNACMHADWCLQSDGVPVIVIYNIFDITECRLLPRAASGLRDAGGALLQALRNPIRLARAGSGGESRRRRHAPGQVRLPPSAGNCTLDVFLISVPDLILNFDFDKMALMGSLFW